jgi:hypothetical protein
MRRTPVVRIGRISSLLKHGAYGMGLLPGENPAAFEKLLRSLVAEFSPNGVLEEDIVCTMARILWRKRHMDTFGACQRAWERYNRIQSRQRSEIAKGLMAERLIQSYTVSDEFPPEAQKELRENVEKEAREELGDDYKFIEAGKDATLHSIMERFDVEARLDAMLDANLKRLLHLRGVKSLSSSSPSTRLLLHPDRDKAA